MNPPSETDVLQQLTEIFHQLFDDDSIRLTMQTTARDIPEWDSMMHVSLIVTVESRFRIKFQTSEVESLKNVGDFVALIRKRLAAKTG